jgi:hypothetical protein
VAKGVVVPVDKPFFGTMGLAPDPTMGRISSGPPGVHTGNLDNKDLIAGTTLFMPVHAPGAMFSAGDAHAAQGLVSRASPVHTAVRNCTRDEGRPFGFGDQVADPKPPRAAAVKSRGGERRGNVGTVIPAGKVERGERKQTASEASKAV